MCVGKLRLGCCELHTQPQRAGQVEAEVFLAADQVSAPLVEAEAVAVSLITDG
jgi:hypothetical protein